MINKKRAGENIRSIRTNLDISQKGFAEMLCVSTQAVSKWETGNSLPDLGVLLKLSWIGKRTINRILDGSTDDITDVNGVQRDLHRIANIAKCLSCDTNMRVDAADKMQVHLTCENGHKTACVDGVVDFKAREIKGEDWSYYLRNYDQYLELRHTPPDPRILQGDPNMVEALWEITKRRRPGVIVDIASGMGTGIEHTIRKINWPCTVVMTDLSHRILVWNRKFFSEEVKNPFVDIVYLACDCANLPVHDSTIDLVTSSAGFESMQNKMLEGFQEAFRVLKHGATSASVLALIENRHDVQSSKWMKLMDEACRIDGFKNPIRDYTEWQRICAETGYRHTEITRIYDDLPAPEVDVLPFENNILQWVGMHIVESSK